MKKSSKVLLSLVVVVALLAIIYRLVNKAPSSELAPNEQIVEVMTDGGCRSAILPIPSCLFLPIILLPGI